MVLVNFLENVLIVAVRPAECWE